MPAAAMARVEMHGPAVGMLYLIDDGTRVRVMGRAWKFFDNADVIEVTVERTDGTIIEEHLSIEEFEALTEHARVMM